MLTTRCLQGAQIIDDAFCGGPDLPQLESSFPLVSRTAANNTAAIILMGNPRHVAGLPFNVGNATEPGVSTRYLLQGGVPSGMRKLPVADPLVQFAARPPNFKCSLFENRIQAYCDSPDPFCAKGNDPDTHQGYGFEYGKEALDFIVGKVVAN